MDTLSNRVILKLTYPNGTVEDIEDKSYIIKITRALNDLGSPYTDYKTLNVGQITTELVFEVQRFFMDWFEIDGFENGKYKLDVTWIYSREVTEKTLDFDTTKKVGDLVVEEYKETFEYNLYSQDYVSNTAIGPQLP